MAETKYNISNPKGDYLDKLLRWDRIIVAAVVAYATFFQYVDGKTTKLFIQLSVSYLLWNLISGVFLIYGKKLGRFYEMVIKNYNTIQRRLVRFIFNITVCSILHSLSSGGFEYYLLYFPWILAFNFYVLEISFPNSRKILGIEYDKFFSILSGFIVSTIYFVIQYFKLQNPSSSELPGMTHLSSTFLKTCLLLSVSILSYWFWKKRKINADYVNNIKSLHQIGQGLTTATSFEKVLEEIVNGGVKTLKADVITILQYDYSKKIFTTSPIYGGHIYNLEEERKASKKYQMAQRIIKMKQDEFLVSPESNEQTFFYRQKMKSVAALYLEVESLPVGVMFINYRNRHSFTQEEQQILKIYSNYAAIAIKNVLEKEALLLKLNFSATKILDIKDKLSINFPEQENSIIKLVLDECLKLFKEDLGYYSAYDINSNELQIVFASEHYTNKIGFRYSAEIGITGRAARTKELIVMKKASDTPDYKKFKEFNKGDEKNLDENVNSAVAIPLSIDDRVIGVYMIESDQADYFSKVDEIILRGMITLASIAIKNIRLVQDLETSKTFFETTRLIDNKIIDKHLNLKTVLGLILKKCLELVRGEHGNILLKISDDELLIVESTSQKLIGKKLQIADSVSGSAVIEKKVIYIPDLRNADIAFKSKYKPFLGENMQCDLAVPLIIKDEVIGIFNTESYVPGNFSDDDIRKVQGFAFQAAIAIYISKLFDDVKKHQDRIKELASIDRAILDLNLNLSDTLEVILKKSLELMKKKHGEIILRENNENEECLIIKKSTNSSAENTLFPFKSICGLAINKNKTVYLPSIDKNWTEPLNLNEDFYIPSDKEKQLYYAPFGSAMKSELVVPLRLKGNVIGVFNIESSLYNDFNEDDRGLLINLSGAAAIAIHNARQFEEINDKNKALENSVDKEKIKMSVYFGEIVNHRIAGSIGTIRNSLKGRLLYGKYGKFADEVNEEFKKMLACADRVIDMRKEISEKIIELFHAKITPIDFKEVSRMILQNEDFKFNKNIKFNIIGFEQLPPIMINIDLFMEIVTEIITNAIKSMPEGGSIDIIGKTRGNYNVLSFIDSGCGIEEEDLPKIYDKGHSKWADGKGSGLGLFELKLFVEFFDGQIEATSKVGVGTTFTIKFPIFKKDVSLN